MVTPNMPIQAVSSDCSSTMPSGRVVLRSKTPMLSSPRNPPWKMLFSCASLRLTHQVKLSSSFWKTRFRKKVSPFPRVYLLLLVNVPRGPGMHGRIDIAEGPFVGGQLAVGMHVPLVEQQEQLVLGEGGIDQGHRHAVEGQVPRGVPGVLPGVGHEDDIVVAQMPPAPVAAALGRWQRAGRVATQPFIHIVGVELLAPEQAGQRLSLHSQRILCLGRTHRPVKLVGLLNARGEDLSCVVKRRTWSIGGQAR